jgi:hypothetical protein
MTNFSMGNHENQILVAKRPTPATTPNLLSFRSAALSRKESVFPAAFLNSRIPQATAVMADLAGYGQGRRNLR